MHRTRTLAAAAILALALAGCQPADSSSSSGSSGGSSGGAATGGTSGGASSASATPRARGGNIGGSGAGGVSGGTGEACTADMSFSNFDLDHPSQNIGAGARVICLDPPKFITHTLYLEYQSAGDGTDSWQTDGPDSYSTQNSYNPEAGFIVHARCRVATWRLRYKAIGVDASGAAIDINYTSAKLSVFVPKCP